MLFDADAPDATRSGLGSLIGHVSRVNDQWRTAGDALFILHGPDDYIEADWLNTPGSANVPTWNYVTVHVYGRLVAHDDPDWTLAAVRRLSAAHGDASVDAMGEAEVGRLLRAIVGVELVISRVDGKAKMSQNKTPDAVAQVIDGLRAAGGEATADWMAEHSPAESNSEGGAARGTVAAAMTPSSSRAVRIWGRPATADSDNSEGR